MAAIFADWQSCSDANEMAELADPIQSQYREFFIVVGCRFKGEPASRLRCRSRCKEVGRKMVGPGRCSDS